MNREDFKIPNESPNYREASEYVRKQISTIIHNAIESGDNKIFINTNLKRGLPLENINKVAGPFVEAWAVEKFEMISSDPKNEYHLINVEPGARLDPYDIILQFKRKKNGNEIDTANVDVKATSEDIVTSGRSPNITSYARIRTEYIKDPDYIFIILSLKHKVYSEKGKSGMTNGIMEVVSYNAYDIKYLSDKDISYNPALGTGQIQIRDIHYVTEKIRTAWEFCQLLDNKFIKCKDEKRWEILAKKYGWLKGTTIPETDIVIDK